MEAPEARAGAAATAFEKSAGDFLTYLRDVRQLSAHTLDNYRRDLVSLQRCSEQQGRQSPDELVEADIRQWVSQLHRRGLAGSSIHMDRIQIRARVKRRTGIGHDLHEKHRNIS